MNAAFKNSLPGRAAAAVAENHGKWFEASLLYAILRFFSRYYETSALKRVWERFLSTKTGIHASLYGRMLAALHRFTERLGARIAPSLRQSAVTRALCAAGRLLRRLLIGSLPGRLLAGKLTLRRFVILLFTFYLPLDYMIRDVVRIAALSALWDELFFLAAACLAV